jgi:DNA polymerase III, gamma and tau subunit
MFNSELKEKAKKVLEEVYGDYKRTLSNTINHSESLYEKKLHAVEILKNFSSYIQKLSNKPIEFETSLGKIEMNIKKFDNKIEEVTKEINQAEVVPTAMAGAGALAGAGVAAFAPTAAMAIATTFGTASTGTAIASLSGAAATNAALAWLGGGALAAGGGGIVGGEALLALAGPIGWAIGGSALLGAGLILNNKNKEAADKIEEQILEIKKEIMKIMKLDIKVLMSEKEIKEISDNIENGFELIKYNNDYNQFSIENKERLATLINISESLSTKIGEFVSNE